jgi:hypothetical protein
MKLKKKIVRLKNMSDKDDSFVDLPPGELISFMWELTREVWSLRGKDFVERRLQRNVTDLVRQ